jgi:hypothetical protein
MLVLQRETRAMSSSYSYSLPATAQRALDSLVDRIEARPGALIDPAELLERGRLLDAKAAAVNLPAAMTEEDFIGILKLALLTESATDSYAAAINNCADRFDARWLRRFTDRVWSPDELTHYAPYKLILLSLGFEEAELDRDIKETSERQYVHHGGVTPVHMTTFGMIQEYLTDSWHGLISNLLRHSSPEAALMVRRIKRRETLHTVWYRDMTALQVEGNPHFVDDIADQVHQFHMPSMSLVPELHTQGVRWQQLMGADFERLFRDLFRFVQETLQNVRLTGRLVLRLAAAKNVNLGPISGRQLELALRRLGGPGYGLIGEAALQRVGLGYMFNCTDGERDGVFGRREGVHERVRGLVRSWIAERLPPPAQVTLGIAPNIMKNPD